jgi:UDP-N-acetylglucosamine 2-epimerase (non-hydrolysing)
MEEGSVMMVGLNKTRVIQALKILENQNNDSLNIVSDYSKKNVSDKVIRIILSYVDYVNQNVWKKK